MKISELRMALNAELDAKVSFLSVSEEDDLDQGQADSVTDGCATVLETVNPNGPAYPSTPR
jgi:hypothetical protein